MDDWDWELLQDSPQTTTTTLEHQPQQEQQVDVEENSTTFSTHVDNNSTRVFQTDYFSIDSHHPYVQDEDEDEDEDDSSDNPSWIDPTLVSGPGERIRNSSSSSDSSEPISYSIHLIHSHHSNCDHALNKDDVEDQVEGKDEGEVERVVSEEEVVAEVNEEKKLVWWKVPLQVLRYCVLKVSPVWSLSMAAAAIMGFIIIRRRYLYNIKRKTQGLQLKLTVDDKKVSQFMSRAARLNEAFSVVKRVPMIRPSLPAPGLAPWPVMSMR